MSNIVNYNIFGTRKGLGLNLSQIFVTSYLNSSYNTKTKIGAAQRSSSDKQRPIWHFTNFYQQFSNKLPPASQIDKTGLDTRTVAHW